MTDENGVLIFYNDVLARIDNQHSSDALGKKIIDYYRYTPHTIILRTKTEASARSPFRNADTTSP